MSWEFRLSGPSVNPPLETFTRDPEHREIPFLHRPSVIQTSLERFCAPGLKLCPLPQNKTKNVFILVYMFYSKKEVLKTIGDCAFVCNGK